MVRVLGIDPGSIVTGWGVLEGNPSRPDFVECGAIRLATRRPLPERLDGLYGELIRLAERLRPELAAVETPFHGVNAKSAIHLAQARGVILAALGRCAIPVAEYAPAQIKLSVTGNGRAQKEQVQTMVMSTLASVGDGRGHDVYDALAVAICHMSRHRFRRAVDRATAGSTRTTR